MRLRTDAALTVVTFLDSYNGVRPKNEEKRTMLNKLILFCTFAIFMLAVGGVVTPVWAHDDCEPGGKHSSNHPHCNVDPPPAESYPLYDVFIDWGIVGDKKGFLLPGLGTNWIWNGRQVGSTYADRRIFPLDMTHIIDDLDDGVGTGCFPSVVLMGGFFRKHKKSTANGMFWFPGTTTSDPVEEVLYLLIIEGTFADSIDTDFGFPGNNKIMYMTDWELKVENAGADVASRSCEGSGTFGGNVVTVTFEEIIEEQ
jgi:hypothetical protein